MCVLGGGGWGGERGGVGVTSTSPKFDLYSGKKISLSSAEFAHRIADSV